jgi:ATP/maltotriose-dependent transcriptional regulator MalT/CheY-like chemotaxis protein
MTILSIGQSRSKKKILLVDDEPDNLRLLVKILPKDQYSVHPAICGAAALQFVETTLPDIILLDVRMPAMNGYQVCNELKGNERTRDIPIIFITAGSEIADKAKAFARGGIDYVTKPFVAEEVLLRIKAHLTIFDQQRLLQDQVKMRTAEVGLLSARLNQEIRNRKEGKLRLVARENVANAVLIESKISPPQPSANFVPLQRIEAKFDASLGCRVTSLIAPTGFGKSTTLARLHAHAVNKNMSSAWIGLDNDHNDPARFIQYLIGAFKYARIGVENAAVAHSKLGGDSDTINYVLDMIIRDLNATDSTIGIFLDDYHLIENEDIHRAMNRLIAGGPSNFKLFIASRTELPVQLSKLRLAKKLYEIGIKDLSLQPDEVSKFMTSVGGHSLDWEQVRLLHGSTEGWAAGLQLASLALSRGEQLKEFVHEYSGTDYEASKYFSECVLADIPEKLIDFLCFTAMFDRFSLELCRDLFSEDYSLQLLEQVKTRNLFLIPLDGEHAWFRYHRVFRGYLKSRSIARNPEETKRIYQRASIWFERHGFPHEAITYGLAGGDFSHAADMVAENSLELSRGRGGHATLLNWIKLLPPQYLAQRPNVRLTYAWALVCSHRASEAEVEIASLEALVPEISSGIKFGSPSGEDLRKKLVMLRCVQYALTDRSSLALPLCLDWLARWERTNGFEVETVHTILAYAAYKTNDRDLAIRNLIKAKRWCEQENSFHLLSWVTTITAIVAYEQGNISETNQILAEGLAKISNSLSYNSPGTAMLLSIKAQLSYEKNLLEEAELLLEGALPQAKEYGFPETVFAAYRTKARLLATAGHWNQADSCLADCAVVANKAGMARLSATVEVERIWLHLSHGEIARAEQAFVKFRSIHGDFTCDDGPLIANLIEIRLQLATGKTSNTQLLLRKLLADARRRNNIPMLVTIFCLKAVFLTRCGNRDKAMRTLDEALEFGAAGGLCRTFVDEGDLIGELLRDILVRRTSMKNSTDQDSEITYLQSVVSAFGGKVASNQLIPTAPKISHFKNEEFSERELQILRLIARGLGNQESAQQLFVSEATIKWHLHNIFGKLTVRNRSSAIARARELSLI